MSYEWPGQRIHQYTIYDNHDALLDILQGDEKRNINTQDQCGRTPVYTAVSYNSIKCLEILLQHGADPSMAGGDRISKMTPLHWALLEHKLDAISLLLEYGADLNKVDATGLSPIDLAKSIATDDYKRIFEVEVAKRQKNAFKVVEELYNDCENGDLESVKDTLKSLTPSILEMPNVEIADKEFRTALNVTAHKGHVEIMNELLRVVSELKYSPSVIHTAVADGQVEIVKMLLQKFPECCQTINEFNQIPFHLACKMGDLELVKLLLEWNYPDQVYQTFIDQHNKVEYVLPFSVNLQELDSKTGLYLACESGYEDVVEYLVSFTLKARREEQHPKHFADDLSSPCEFSGCHIQDDNATVDFRPVLINMDGSLSQTSIQMEDFERKAVSNINFGSSTCHSLSCVWVAVKHRHLRVVEILAKAGAIMTLTESVNNIEFSSLLWLALKNSDVLMLDKLLLLGVPDLNNVVFEEAIRNKPDFVAYFLKHKASEDKQNSINKVLMKKEYAKDNVGDENVMELQLTDPKYRQIFPVEAVMIRWQNLKVLSSVDPVWLIRAVSLFNPEIKNFNMKMLLFAITKVDISNNSLTMMPVSLLQLPSLCILIATSNQIIEFPAKTFKLECRFLEDLNIQSNMLSKIPDYIFTLPKIKCVNASCNQINELPVSMWQSTSLHTLDLSGNKLEDLPVPQRGGTTIRKVYEKSENDVVVDSDADVLYQSQTCNNSHVIRQLLKRATQWAKNVIINDDAVRTAENHTKGLKTLKLGKNLLKSFPDFLSCCCPTLENLELQYNKLESVGNLGSYPKLLGTLDLSHNEISSMDDWQVEDSKQKFFCSSTQMSLVASGSNFGLPTMTSCTHRSHSKLENLECLDLSFNKLSSLVVMRTMKIRDLEEMQKSFQDKELAEKTIQNNLIFPNINTLNVDCNQLTRITDDIKELKQLKILTLKKNVTLKELPPALGLLEKLQRIEVDLCPIEGPIQDVIKRASDRAGDIIGFLRSILEEAEQYNCMNLMIIGSSNIGKTSLLEQLVKRGKTNTQRTHFVQRRDINAPGTRSDGQPLSTVGIDISSLILEGKKGTVEFRTWDFAGQKEYYATHQYFLSPRSLYLVLWNLVEGKPGIDGLRQWLVNIQAQAPGAPVIIVGTHLDEIQARRRDFPKDWENAMRNSIIKRYQQVDNNNVGLPKVLDIINVGAGRKKPMNIDKLKDLIYDKVFSLKHPARRNENMLGHKVPKKYLKLQECIARIVKNRKDKNEEPVLDANSYLLCVMEEMSKGDTTTNFRNKDDLYQATRFLHENGVLCHFEDTSLCDQYFLEPQWLCDQLAKVITVDEVQNFSREGIMRISDLKLLYRDSDRITRYILSLLNKFEVAIQFDEQHLLLPSLLPTHRDVDPDRLKEIPLKQKPASNAPLNMSAITGFSAMSDAASTHRNMTLINIQATQNVIFSNARLYLLTYFPSGFWPRLITRILADESFYEPAMKLFKIPQEIKENCFDIASASPCWRCWQTGIELVYFGNVIMQVKEVCTDSVYAHGICNYAIDGLKIKCRFEDMWNILSITDSVILEISFKCDKLSFTLETKGSFVRGNQSFNSVDKREIYHNEMAKTAILAKMVEHIDSLLQDWFPEIGECRFIQSCSGRYLVTRVVPCPQCLQAEMRFQENSEGSWLLYSGNQLQSVSVVSENLVESNTVGADKADDRVICAFLVEKCIQNVLEGRNEICIVHSSVSPQMMPIEDGTMKILHITPDASFQDIDESLIVEDDTVHVTGTLGKGAFGKVSSGKLTRGDGSEYNVAVKVLYDSKTNHLKEQGKQSMQISLETLCLAYITARQEVSILLTVEHDHIVPLLGLSRRPLALLLALAPKGSLKDIIDNRHKDDFHLPVWVIKQVVIQTADALDYLHGRNIIYRDLKSDNVLVWNFPAANDLDPKQAVLVKLADYGISRSVLPAGTKGFGGTPPFIAPEILMHLGKDTYTSKVDIFSFGMFMFELLTCRHPLEEINNINIHVIHGGRPMLTNEDAFYPSPMLDLMTICWDSDPRIRPTAEQICMIASSPQFCHLSDAITLDNHDIVVSACTVYLENASCDDYEQLHIQTQVWIASKFSNNYKVKILTYGTNNKCAAVKELKQTGIVATCNVNNKIWCLDNLGDIHIYSPISLLPEETFHLDVVNSFEVMSMSYHHNNGGYIIVLLKDKLTVVFCFTEKMIKLPNELKPHRISKHCFCATVVQYSDRIKVWLGSDNGEILKRSIDDLEVDDGSISPDSVPNTIQKCYFLTTGVTSESHSVWSYNMPGCKVFHWDTDLEKVVASLDCSSIVPAADRYNVQKTKTFKATDSQVTALSVISKYLYVSTTWGCLIVADAKSMKPFSIFRCHGNEDFYCKAILPLGPIGTFARRCYVSDQEAVQNFTLGQGSGTGNDTDSISQHSGIVTIGCGYVDIICHVTKLNKDALLRRETDRPWSLSDIVVNERMITFEPPDMDTYVLSWEPRNWEFY